jgi:hypothetical protein
MTAILGHRFRRRAHPRPGTGGDSLVRALVSLNADYAIFSVSSAMVWPMAIEAVAAGEGAFKT